jgi:AcrR family transcriptional regulator
MVRTAQQTPAQGRQLLLDVARRLFLERGFANVSIQQIAEEAKMTKGAPYYHFANKDDLFIQVSLEIIGDLKQTLADALEQESPFQDRLEQAVADVLRSCSGDITNWYADLLRMIDKKQFTESLVQAQGSTEFHHIFLPTFEAAVERGEIRRVPAEVAAHVFFLLLKSALDDFHHDVLLYGEVKRDVDVFAKQLIDIFLHGVA